jgi:hypothetical protein
VGQLNRFASFERVASEIGRMSEIDEQAAERGKPAFAVSAREFAQPSLESLG